jgi:ribosomal protein L40E
MAEPDGRKRRSSADEAELGDVPIDGESEDEGVCGKCGATAHLHEGLCRRCHRVALDERRVAARHEPHQHPPDQAPTVPLHGPPVRRRGA